MSRFARSVILEIFVIVAVAGSAGVLWNRSLLVNAWQGKVVVPGQATPATGEQAIPLPLGLMQAKEFHDRREALFIDARDSKSYREGHIDGAVSLPLERADEEASRILSATSLTTTLIVYCNGFDCHDSRTLAEKLVTRGYREVFVFEGGFPEWRDASYPVSRQ